MHQRTRFISFLLVVSILLSTLYLPIVAEDTAVPEAVSPAISSAPETVANAPAELLQGIPVDFESEAILKHVDQDAFRTANHTLRLPKEESLNTYVYMNDNGTKTVYFMDENVKYVDKEGNVQEKDISLKETKNGFTTVKNDVSVFIPTNAANGIQVSHSIGNVKLIPQNSLLVVAGRQDGDSVLYPNYFGKGISLRYTPLLSGVKEDIILASYTGTHSFQFALETNGLFVYEDASGYYVAASADAEERYALGEIIVYDAVGRPSMGSMTVKTITAGRRYVLTVSADPAFLTDADTVYPVTIDPTITVNGQTDASLIWDVPIFSGYPTWTCGAYQYLTLGNAGGNYGTGRAVVKLPGLYQSSIYQSLTAEQILDVSFYCSDGSGNASQYVSLYPHMGSTTWTESNASWNSIGMYESGYDYGTQVAHGVFTKFDITELVQLWKFGLFFEGAGFILVNADEVTREKHKAIHATEYATASYRPYVTMMYAPTISLNKNSMELREDEQETLIATVPSGNPVFWWSSNPAVATVSMDGTVTALKAGTVYIYAMVETNDGLEKTVYCIVTVRVPDGIYKIINENFETYLIATGILEGTSVKHVEPSQIGNEFLDQLRQCWRIHYVGNGLYTIRAVHITVMGLSASSQMACLKNINIFDDIDTVSPDNLWLIEWDNGYTFRKSGNSNCILRASETSSSVYVDDCIETYGQLWYLSSVDSVTDGVFLYDVTTQKPVSLDKIFYITPKQTKDIETLGLIPASYGNNIIQPYFRWHVVEEESVVDIESLSGKITGISPGLNVIRGSEGPANNPQYVYYKVKVLPLQEGDTYIRNRNSGQYLQIDNDASPSYSDSGEIMEQYPFDNGQYQLWEIFSLDNGYYKIISKKSGLALSVPAAQLYEEDIALVQETYVGSYRQQWGITLTAYGSYKVKARSSEGQSVDLVMATGSSVVDSGTDIEQREYLGNNSFKDEWYFNFKTTEIQYEVQEQIYWCWVACARMLCTRYMFPAISQASAAVYVKSKIDTQNPTEIQKMEANAGGSKEDIIDAIQYLIGYDNCYSHESKIYSETVLKALLDDQNPVIVSWHKVDGSGKGHSIVVYGTARDVANNRTLFMGYDPDSQHKGTSYWTYDFLCDTSKGYYYQCDVYDYDAETTIRVNVNDGYSTHYRWSGVVTFKISSYDQMINNPYT